MNCYFHVSIVSFFKTGENVPQLTDKGRIDTLYMLLLELDARLEVLEAHPPRGRLALADESAFLKQQRNRVQSPEIRVTQQGQNTTQLETPDRCRGRRRSIRDC